MGIETIQAIATQSPAMAFAIAMLILLNRNYIDNLRERKEWLESIIRISDKYDAQAIASAVAMTDMKNEMHSLKGKVTEFILQVQVWQQTLREKKVKDE